MKYGVVGLLCVVCVAACWPTKQDPNACDTDVGCVSGTCNLKTHECEGATDAHVGDDGTEHHDLSGTCAHNSDCTADPTKPMCDTTTSECVSCSADMGVCSGNTPVCGPTGACVQCLHQTDCANGQACNTTTNTCVACAKNSDCDVTGICDTTTTPGTSTCAASANILHVDNMKCTAQTPNGSAAAPFCQVNDALGKVTGGVKYVQVVGNAPANQYAHITISNAIDVVIVGPGKANAVNGEGAYFSDFSEPAAVIAPSSGTAKVVLDGLELVGANNVAEPGVNCSNSGGAVNLTVRDCYIHESGAAGVSTSSCTLDLERNLIQGNVGALVVSNGSYTVQNNAFVGSKSAAAVPIQLSTSMTGVFRFNTVVGNQASGGAIGGIDCGSAGMQLIDSSIVVNNMPQGAQFGPKCMLANSVVGTADATDSGTHLDPTFNTDGYHLANDLANDMCCVDVIPTTTIGEPTLDIDGDKRPMGKGYDIGADEVRSN